jgi:hypothetical protein
MYLGNAGKSERDLGKKLKKNLTTTFRREYKVYKGFAVMKEIFLKRFYLLLISLLGLLGLLILPSPPTA